MFEEILSNLLTKKDLDTLKHELRSLENTDYEFGSDGLEEVLSADISLSTAEAIRSDLRNNSITVEEYVKKLKEKISGYQIIELTLAFKPTRRNIETIGEWVRNNLGEKILVDYKRSPGLLGGAVVVSKGEYRNLSLNKAINVFFEKEKVKISEILSV